MLTHLRGRYLQEWVVAHPLGSPKEFMVTWKLIKDDKVEHRVSFALTSFDSTANLGVEVLPPER